GGVECLRLKEKGTMDALLWNVKGKNVLTLYDLAHNVQKPVPKLLGELASGLAFSKDGSKLAMNIAGAAQPTDIWIMDVKTLEFRQLTFSPHPAVDLPTLVP